VHIIFCRPSLRDEDGQILAALDKNHHADKSAPPATKIRHFQGNVRAPITQGGGFGNIFQLTSHGCRLWNYLQAKSVELLGPFRRPADWFAEMRTVDLLLAGVD